MRRTYVFLTLFVAAFAVFLVLTGNTKHSVVKYGEIETPPADADVTVGAPRQETGKTAAPTPEIVNALYATSWSASSPAKMDYLASLVSSTDANAIVMDIKDFSGYITYATGNSEISKYEKEHSKIKDVAKLVESLHEKNIYAIARIVVFQDPVFAAAKPELAIRDKTTGKIWLDNKGLAWMDPSSKEVWDYNILVAKNALLKGFDEINFDYIRFPSDGNIDNMSFPFYDGSRPKKEVIKEFYSYIRKSLPDAVISADIFGLTTSTRNDLGIGQYLEDSFGDFNFVCPMVYPSHFAPGFMGFKDPAAHPYEVVKYSMAEAKKRLTASGMDGKTKLRPWIQDFTLGYAYGVNEVRGQITAVSETSGSGWMAWDPKNNYTQKGLISE